MKYEVTGVLAEDPLRDLAIVALKTQKTGFPFLRISSRRPEQGERILVMGNPGGLDFTLSDGLISAVRNYRGLHEVIQISAPISPGSSGSPIMDLAGEVLALAFGGLSDGQNLNFGIGSTHIFNISSKAQKTVASVPAFGATDKAATYLKISRLIQVGFDAYAADNHDKALLIADEILELMPNLAEAHALRSAALEGLGDLDNALKAISRAIELEPEDPAYYRFRALILTSMRQFEQALKDNTKAIEMGGPQTASGYYFRSSTFKEMGNVRSALEDINNAIDLEPSDPTYYESRAGYHFELRDTPQAIADFRKALQLHTASRDKSAVQGLIYLLQGERDKGLECVREAARLGHKASKTAIENLNIQ